VQDRLDEGAQVIDRHGAPSLTIRSRSREAN
jgi:hypothetical protein